jgi:hypothetical protein
VLEIQLTFLLQQASKSHLQLKRCEVDKCTEVNQEPPSLPCWISPRKKKPTWKVTQMDEDFNAAEASEILYSPRKPATQVLANISTPTPVAPHKPFPKTALRRASITQSLTDSSDGMFHYF